MSLQKAVKGEAREEDDGPFGPSPAQKASPGRDDYPSDEECRERTEDTRVPRTGKGQSKSGQDDPGRIKRSKTESDEEVDRQSEKEVGVKLVPRPPPHPPSDLKTRLERSRHSEEEERRLSVSRGRSPVRRTRRDDDEDADRRSRTRRRSSNLASLSAQVTGKSGKGYDSTTPRPR